MFTTIQYKAKFSEKLFKKTKIKYRNQEKIVKTQY